MNIDQRLEALAHSVELIAEMQIKTEEQMARTHLELERLSRENRATRRLFASILADHETRIQSLEDDEPEPNQNGQQPA